MFFMYKVSFPCIALAAALVAAGASVLTTGCKKEQDAASQRQAQMEQETLLDKQIEELFSKIQAAENENRLEEALKLTEEGIADETFSFQRSRFLDQKVNLLLKLGREKDASAFVMEGWRTDMTNIPPAFESIARFYQSRQDNTGMIAWCKSLVAPGSSVPASRSSQIWFWDCNAALAITNGPEVQLALAAIMREQPEAQTLKQLSDTITPFFGKPDKAEFLTPQLQALAANATPAYKTLFSSLILQGFAAQKKWPEAMAAFDVCLSQFPDEDLYKSSRTFFNALLHNGQTNLLQAASEKVVFTASGKPRSINLASRHWIDCGEKFNTSELADRLHALLSAKVSADQVGVLYDQYFYYDVNNTNLVRRLVKLGGDLIPVCTDTNTVNAIKVKLLDGSFILEDYASAVKMLEAGIPGKDALWHKMSLPKVRAHLALQLADAAKAKKDTKAEQAHIRDAICNFRIFMDGLKNDGQDEEYDPTTNVAYCKEWILARNSKRIADLYAKRLHDKASAEKELAKAKEDYRAALNKSAGNPEAMAILIKEVAPYGLTPEPVPAKKPSAGK
jgi:hypothetical protein